MKRWSILAVVAAACGDPSPSGGDEATGDSGGSTAVAETSTGSVEASTGVAEGSSSGSEGAESSSSTGVAELLPCDAYADQLDALGEALAEVVADGSVPGASLAIRFPGSEICTLQAGLGDVPADAAVGPDDLWRIGSVTKNIVAGLVLQAVEDGLVGLDDPVTDHVLAGEAGLTDVTVRQLLSHRSGVPNYTDPSSDPFWTQWQTDPDQAWDPVELVGYAWDVADGSCFAPGMGWSYSNTNFVILGLLVEELRGESLATLLEEQVDALELGDFFIESDPDIPPGLVRGYLIDPDMSFCALLDPDTAYLDDQQLCDATASIHTSIAGASGAITATPAGTLIWLDAFLDGEVFDPALLADVLDLQDTYPQMGSCPPGDPSLRYGLGTFELVSGTGTTLVGHNGNVNGYQTMAFRSEEHDFTLVFTLNRGDVSPFPILDDLLASFGA